MPREKIVQWTDIQERTVSPLIQVLNSDHNNMPTQQTIWYRASSGPVLSLIMASYSCSVQAQ